MSLSAMSSVPMPCGSTCEEAPEDARGRAEERRPVPVPCCLDGLGDGVADSEVAGGEVVAPHLEHLRTNQDSFIVSSE